MPRKAEPSGEEAHLRALEALYDSAPVNRMFESQLLPRISSGQWYKNAAGQWVQR